MPETTFDTLNLKACLFAIERYFDEYQIRLPVMASVTITDQAGRTLSGQTIEAFWNSVSHFDLLSVGINCALGPEQMRPYVEELSRITPIVSSAVIPTPGCPTHSVGLTNTAEEMTATLREFVENGWLNIVGGCCGTTPEYIRCFRRHGEGRRRRDDDPPCAPYTRLKRPGGIHAAPRVQFRHDRRTDQRHRISPLRSPDPRETSSKRRSRWHDSRCWPEPA